MSNASIGSIGKAYYDGNNNRRKGFLEQVFNNAAAVRETLQQCCVGLNGETRVTLRLPLGAGVDVSEIRRTRLDLGHITLSCEALLPVDKAGVQGIAYFGGNTEDRMSDRETSGAQQVLLCRVMNREQRQRQLAPGHTIECCHPGQGGWSQQDAEDLVDVYEKTFTGYLVEFTTESVAAMLRGNLTAVIRHEGHIVAVAMAEIATLNLDGQEISLAEISEVATHSDHQGQGFAGLLYQQVVAALRERGTDIVFSETRANHGAIMAAARKAGLEPRGLLPQHCVISSPYKEVDQQGDYGDLVVFSL